MALISEEKLAQKAAQQEPFATKRWYPVNEPRKRIYFEAFTTGKAAIAYAEKNLAGEWTADLGYRLNDRWDDLKRAGWVLLPGRDRRGGARSGAGPKGKGDAARNYPVYVDADTLLVIKLEAKRRTSAGDAFVSVKAAASDLVLSVPREQWPRLLDCWEVAGGAEHFTTCNLNQSAANCLDEMIAALEQEKKRRGFPHAITKAAIVRTLASHWLPA